MTLNIDADYAIWDGGETVTLRQIRPNGSATASVANGVNGPVDARTFAASGVALEGNERAWSLNATDVGAAGVEMGDIITDASGDEWYVLSVAKKTLDTRWYCLTRKQTR